MTELYRFEIVYIVKHADQWEYTNWPKKKLTSLLFCIFVRIVIRKPYRLGFYRSISFTLVSSTIYSMIKKQRYWNYGIEEPAIFFSQSPRMKIGNPLISYWYKLLSNYSILFSLLKTAIKHSIIVWILLISAGSITALSMMAVPLIDYNIVLILPIWWVQLICMCIHIYTHSHKYDTVIRKARNILVERKSDLEKVGRKSELYFFFRRKAEYSSIKYSSHFSLFLLVSCIFVYI